MTIGEKRVFVNVRISLVEQDSRRRATAQQFLGHEVGRGHAAAGGAEHAERADRNGVHGGLHDLVERRDGSRQLSRRGTARRRSWSEIHNAAATSKPVSGKTPGSWEYRVRACNAAGCSGYSGIATVAIALPPATSGATPGAIPGGGPACGEILARHGVKYVDGSANDDLRDPAAIPAAAVERQASVLADRFE